LRTMSKKKVISFETKIKCTACSESPGYVYAARQGDESV